MGDRGGDPRLRRHVVAVGELFWQRLLDQVVVLGRAWRGHVHLADLAGDHGRVQRFLAEVELHDACRKQIASPIGLRLLRFA